MKTIFDRLTKATPLPDPGYFRVKDTPRNRATFKRNSVPQVRVKFLDGGRCLVIHKDNGGRAAR